VTLADSVYPVLGPLVVILSNALLSYLTFQSFSIEHLMKVIPETRRAH